MERESGVGGGGGVGVIGERAGVGEEEEERCPTGAGGRGGRVLVPSSMKGELHLILRTACEVDFGTLCAYFLDIRMTASNVFFFFLVWPRPKTAMGIILCNCLVGALPYSRGLPIRRSE